MVKIGIDSGHGGVDSGAVGNGLKEKDITLKIGNLVTEKLGKYENVKVINSRVTDKTVSLKQRTDLFNKEKVDYLVSIHVNSFTNSSVRGYEDFIYNGKVGSNTSRYREIMHKNIIKKLGNITNRGMKRENFHMLRESKMPAMLCEFLFISNKADSDLLKQNSFINKIADGIVNGIVEIFKLKLKKVEPNKPKKKVYYRAVAGSYESEKNADRIVENLKKQGYSAFKLRYEE